MIVDIHAHVIDAASGGHGLRHSLRSNWALRYHLGQMRKKLAAVEGPVDERLRRAVYRWIDASRIDRAVILALDGVHRPDGTPVPDQTQMEASNDFVLDFAAGHRKLLAGASIHPYRRDALDELDRVAQRGACLVKWIPSAQHIDPADPRCLPFYGRLARYGLPLLSHTGVEHTLSRFSNSLNDPRRLEPALHAGVTVIAAHCGTRLFLHERSFFGHWVKLARAYPACYGDLSAFGLPLHGGPLRQILGDPALLAKVVYGSDFPTPAMPLWSVFRVGLRKAYALRSIANPFDKPYALMKEWRVPDEVFTRAGRLLRLPTGTRAAEGAAGGGAG